MSARGVVVAELTQGAGKHWRVLVFEAFNGARRDRFIAFEDFATRKGALGFARRKGAVDYHVMASLTGGLTL